MLRLDIRTITEEVRVYMALSLEKTDDLIEVSDCRNESRRYVKRDKGFDKHLAMVEETLARYGLVRNETRVYLHLARSGERKASEVAEAVSLNRTETYKILDDLEKKGLVYSAFEKPLKFTAVPLEKALDSLIDVQRNRTMLLEKEKSRLVDLWLSIPLLKAEDHEKQVFQILEGDEQMIRKANDLLEKAQDEIQIYAPSEYLAQLYHSDFGDSLKRRARRLRITLLTENSSKSLFFIRRMSWGTGKYRIVDLTNLPCFMIVDRKELLIAAQQNDQTKDAVCKKRSRTMALWTNYVAFVEILAMLFAKLGETGQAVHEIPMHFRVQQF
jgi:sugar-specific transcriptional regulator TrmB